MTVKQLYEITQEAFPAMGFPEFLVHLNRIQRRFVTETKCLLTFYQIPIDTAAWYYDVPDDIDEVRELTMRDADGEDIVTDEVRFKMEDRVIYLYDTAGNKLENYPTGATELYLRVVYLPPNLSDPTETSPIESAFHNALISGVIMGKASVSNPALYQIHERIWDRTVREGKLYATREADRTSWNPDVAQY